MIPRVHPRLTRLHPRPTRLHPRSTRLHPSAHASSPASHAPSPRVPRVFTRVPRAFTRVPCIILAFYASSHRIAASSPRIEASSPESDARRIGDATSRTWNRGPNPLGNALYAALAQAAHAGAEANWGPQASELVPMAPSGSARTSNLRLQSFNIDARRPSHTLRPADLLNTSIDGRLNRPSVHRDSSVHAFLARDACRALTAQSA